jgi:hypothetical protein
VVGGCWDVICFRYEVTKLHWLRREVRIKGLREGFCQSDGIMWIVRCLLNMKSGRV